MAEDHARLLAAGLAQLPGIELDPATVQTNMVLFRTPGQSAETFARKLNAAGVRMLATGPDTIRAVTHLMISADDIHRAIELVRNAC